MSKPFDAPRPVSKRSYWRWLLFVAYTGLACAYLIWRGLFTLNSDFPIYAVLFYGAEILSIAAAFVFYAYLVRPAGASPAPPPEPGLKVDVFIATYNEDIDLLRTTAAAARDMDYPHWTWLCDDGRRPEVKELATKLGIGYITRPNNEHFKAGNLNHALGQTKGDIVLVLDADHVPRKQLLTQTLGYFRDPQVGIVQSPQVYYNIDSFQHVASIRRRRLWHEASVFHHMMQPGAHNYNAAFFVGTGALLRRQALGAIGGFATGSITEDIHTSMRLHAAGYRSVYIDQALGYMLAPDTPFAYLLQRLRWAQGSMQLLRWENPLWKRGLKFWQRLGYVNAMGVYLLAFQHLIFYLAPSLYLLAGISPISIEQPGAFGVFVGYICVALAVYKLMAAPHARLFLSECFKMLNMSTFMLASLTILQPHGLRFRVTPKGQHGGLPWSLLFLPTLLFILSLTAAGVGVSSLIAGSERHLGALLFTTFFAVYFAIAGGLMLMHTFERRQTEEAFAMAVLLDGILIIEARDIPVRVERMSQQHAFLRISEPLAPATMGQLSLPQTGLRQTLPVEIVGADRIGSGAYILKTELGELPFEARNQLDHFFFEVAVPRFFSLFQDAPSGPPPLSDAPPPVLLPNEASEEVFVPVRPGLL